LLQRLGVIDIFLTLIYSLYRKNVRNTCNDIIVHPHSLQEERNILASSSWIQPERPETRIFHLKCWVQLIKGGTPTRRWKIQQGDTKRLLLLLDPIINGEQVDKQFRTPWFFQHFSAAFASVSPLPPLRTLTSCGRLGFSDNPSWANLFYQF
jgi:hypothetical protein